MSSEAQLNSLRRYVAETNVTELADHTRMARQAVQAAPTTADTPAGTFERSTVASEPIEPGHTTDERLAELRGFLEAVLPPSAPVYFAFTAPCVGTPGRRVNHPFRSILELAQRLLELDTGAAHEVYFALAGYQHEWVTAAGERRQRCRENVSAVRAAWLDIDVGDDKAREGKGYATRDEARAALDSFLAQLDIAPTFIVSSGQGFHVYWAFPEAVAPGMWQRAASALKRACRCAGLVADRTRTADRTSVLRPPGCTHRKDPKNPRAVTILERCAKTAGFEQFRAAAERLAGMTHVASEAATDGASTGALLQRTGGMSPVDNSALLAGLHEVHSYLRGLSQEDALRLIDSACSAIPDALWADYEFWALTAIAGCVALHQQDGFDRERLIDMLWRHSRRPPQYAMIDREEVREKFDEAGLQGCSMGKLFEAAEQHEWNAAAAVPAPQVPSGALGSPIAPITNAPTIERLLTDNYVMVISRGEGEYFNPARRICMRPGAVNRAEGHLTDKCGRSADHILRTSPLTRRVDFLGFHPAAGETYNEGGYAYANLHCPVAEELQPTAAEARLIMDFLDYLFPRAEDQQFKRYYIQFLGHIAQRPATKIATALLFVGGFGVGKNTAAYDIPSLIVGRRNTQVVSNKVLNSQFSDQLAKAHLVYLDEVHCNGTWQSQEQANNLKSLISDKRVSVHPKGHAAYDIQNRLIVTATSNYEDAMFLQGNDRRWAVQEVKPTRGYASDQHRRYFNVLHRFLESERAAGVLRSVFSRVDLTGFDAQNPPPMTAAKQRMMDLSLSPLEATVRELFHAREYPFDRDLLTMEWLRNTLTGRVPGLDRISDQRLARVLQGEPICAVRLPGPKRLKARRSNPYMGPNYQMDLSGRFRVWALRHADLWRTVSEGSISRHIETGAAPLTNVTEAEVNGDGVAAVGTEQSQRGAPEESAVPPVPPQPYETEVAPHWALPER